MLQGSRFLLWMDTLHRSQSFAQNQLLNFLHQNFPTAVFLALDDRTLFRHCSQECKQMACKKAELCPCISITWTVLFFIFLQEQKRHYLWVCISAPLWKKCWKQVKSGETPETLLDLSRHQRGNAQSVKLNCRTLKEFWSFKDWENTFQIFPMPREHLPEKLIRTKVREVVSTASHEEKQEQGKVISPQGRETGRRLWHWGGYSFCYFGCISSFLKLTKLPMRQSTDIWLTTVLS